MKNNIYYFAIALKNGGYTVAKNITSFVTHNILGDCRVFKTFEEADEAAKYIAAGKSSLWKSGIYINNR